jgi:hypothetical protein
MEYKASQEGKEKLDTFFRTAQASLIQKSEILKTLKLSQH